MSYRRDDVPDATDRLATSLVERLGKDQVFLDVDSIDIGAPFAEVVGNWIDRCDVVLAVIGRSWVHATDDEGRRRLENPGDYVRLEIEAGLQRDVRVVPVLIHGVQMPKSTEVPDSLLPLLDRNAIELSRAYWEFDVDKLVAAINRIASQNVAREGPSAQVGVDAEQAPQPERTPEREPEAARPIEAAPPEPTPVAPRPVKRRSRGPVLAISVALLAVIVALVVVLGSGSSSASWRSLASLPRPLEGAGVTAYQGQIWVAGGCSNPSGACGDPRSWLTTVYFYDPRTSAWGTGPPLPEVRNHPALVSNGSQLYAIGGFGPNGQAQGTVFRLDSPTGRWQLDPQSLPDARGAGAAAWDGKRIVFAGGGDSNNNPTDDVWALAGGKWSAIGHLQQARKHLAGASNGNGTVWFIGGSDQAGAASPLVDIVTDSGVRPGTPVNPVKGSAAIALGSGFCTIAGATARGIIGETQCQPHHSIPDLAPPRNYLGAAVLKDTVYVTGGYNSAHHGGIDTAAAIDAR